LKHTALDRLQVRLNVILFSVIFFIFLGSDTSIVRLAIEIFYYVVLSKIFH